MKSVMVAIGIACGVGGALAGTVATANAQEKKPVMEPKAGAPASSARTGNLGAVMTGQAGGAGAASRMGSNEGLATAAGGQTLDQKARIR